MSKNNVGRRGHCGDGPHSNNKGLVSPNIMYGSVPRYFGTHRQNGAPLAPDNVDIIYAIKITPFKYFLFSPNIDPYIFAWALSYRRSHRNCVLRSMFQIRVWLGFSGILKFNLKMMTLDCNITGTHQSQMTPPVSHQRYNTLSPLNAVHTRYVQYICKTAPPFAYDRPH